MFLKEFFPYYWMNCWMNQKSAKFIRKMNKKEKTAHFEEKMAQFACFSLFSRAEIIFPIWIIFWMNIFVQFWIEGFNFELNIELNHFFARFNVKMNNQNQSATPTPTSGESHTPLQLLFYHTMCAGNCKSVFETIVWPL